MNLTKHLVFPLSCLLILLTAITSNMIAQDNKPHEILINGKIIDASFPDLSLENIMIINLRTQQGIFAQGDNTFSIRILPSDSLVVTATGYSTKKFCLKDSLLLNTRTYVIGINRLSVELKEVTIFRPRDFQKIEEDLKKLGYQESDYKLTDAEAWNSPITALYQAFSRRERSKRKVAELQNADLRHDLLKELLQVYVDTKLIDLPSEDYDKFINYLHLSDETLNTITQYELALYVKEMYERFYR
jgi:hypothetical protein